MFPLRRNIRLRTNESIRSLVRETIITPNDFLVPLFIVEGKDIKEEIASMPNYFRYSLDLLENEVKELWKMGLKSVLLFVKVPRTSNVLLPVPSLHEIDHGALDDEWDLAKMVLEEPPVVMQERVGENHIAQSQRRGKDLGEGALVNDAAIRI